jgi:hypothetical protein
LDELLKYLVGVGIILFNIVIWGLIVVGTRVIHKRIENRISDNPVEFNLISFPRKSFSIIMSPRNIFNFFLGLPFIILIFFCDFETVGISTIDLFGFIILFVIYEGIILWLILAGHTWFLWGMFLVGLFMALFGDFTGINWIRTGGKSLF